MYLERQNIKYHLFLVILDFFNFNFNHIKENSDIEILQKYCKYKHVYKSNQNVSFLTTKYIQTWSVLTDKTSSKVEVV